MTLLTQLLIKKDFFLWDAIIQWREHIYKSDFYNVSKCNYLSGMLKLIESEIINVNTKLESINDKWLNEVKKHISDKQDWALSTRKIRKSCLNSLYIFIQKDFDYSTTPYRRHPKHSEIKYVLSSVWNKATEEIDPQVLCHAVSKINERDAYIVWLIVHTGQTLEKILDLKKENLRVSYMEDGKHAYSAYLDFEEEKESVHIPGHIVDGINSVSNHTKTYLFETVSNKRVSRTQVMRTLKKAGYDIGLTYDLTPIILHRYACAHMTEDKRSVIEQALGL